MQDDHDENEDAFQEWGSSQKDDDCLTFDMADFGSTPASGKQVRVTPNTSFRESQMQRAKESVYSTTPSSQQNAELRRRLKKANEDNDTLRTSIRLFKRSSAEQVKALQEEKQGLEEQVQRLQKTIEQVGVKEIPKRKEEMVQSVKGWVREYCWPHCKFVEDAPQMYQELAYICKIEKVYPEDEKRRQRAKFIADYAQVVLEEVNYLRQYATQSCKNAAISKLQIVRLPLFVCWLAIFLTLFFLCLFRMARVP